MTCYVTAVQGHRYGELWSIPHNQQSSTTESSVETASPPSYNHTAPPPPYTAHARLGEVSIQRSPLQEDSLIGDYLLVDNGDQVAGWLDDTVQEHADDTHDDVLCPDTEEPVATENSGELSHQSFHEDQPAPIAASTPSGSLNELVFMKTLAHNNNLPSVKPIPMLRPIRAQNFSAPNLFATYPPPSDTTHETDSTLNNTLPRVGRLPPLRRKPNLTDNSPRYVRSFSDSRLPSPLYDNYWTLSHNTSTGEYEAISEVSQEPSSSETIDNS